MFCENVTPALRLLLVKSDYAEHVEKELRKDKIIFPEIYFITS